MSPQDASPSAKDDRLLAAARRVIAMLREAADLPFSVRLWDGSVEPLGRDASPHMAIRIETPGVIASLIRWPSLDRLIRHYAHGRIDFEGGTLVDFGQPFALGNKISKRLKSINKLALLAAAAPFLTAKADDPDASRGFEGDAEGAGRGAGDNQRFIQFHYDVGNDFYQLFLDPEMQYSCAYFPTWETRLDHAQIAKLDMICRKLRLRPGETLLDIGCGWGGLLAHAAQHYGVTGYGVTLSEEQLAYAKGLMARRGIADRVTLELRDYQTISGAQFDKIASIGMYEHIGLKNIPAYFAHVRHLLAEDGLFLNHAIARGAKKKKARFSKRPEQRALQKYIFPGGELDDIGHSIAAMEQAGFEIHDVEGWREHYQKTTRLWCERLTARREEAIALVGPETYRIWVAYLGGCSLAFQRGSARIFQTLASKSAKGPSPVPPSRADLYR